MIDNIKVEQPADSSDNVADEGNTLNISDERQGGCTYYTDRIRIKEESDFPNTDDTRESFTYDDIHIKEENTSDIDDMSEEGTSVGLINIKKEWNTYNVGDISQDGTTSYQDNIKEERVSPTMDTTRESFTSDSNDIQEDSYICDIKKEDDMDDISDDFTSDNTDIPEEGVSDDINNFGKSCTFIGNRIKEEDTDVYNDESDVDSNSYYHGDREQLEDEADEAEQTGTVARK